MHFNTLARKKTLAKYKIDVSLDELSVLKTSQNILCEFRLCQIYRTGNIIRDLCLQIVWYLVPRKRLSMKLILFLHATLNIFPREKNRLSDFVFQTLKPTDSNVQTFPIV